MPSLPPGGPVAVLTAAPSQAASSCNGGPRLLVTRPAAQAEGWVDRLRARGLDAHALPLIEIAPTGDAAALEAAWAHLPARAFVMFVSANAVQAFFAARPPAAAWPGRLQAGATGPGTAAALEKAGLAPDQVVQPADDAPAWDAEALWQRLAGRSWQRRSVLVVRGEEGRDWLSEQWRQAGASVDFVAAYRRLRPRWTPAEQALADDAIAQPGRTVWLFSSSEAVGHLAALRPQADWREGRALATHPRIAQATQQLGFGTVQTVGPTVDEVVRALVGRALPPARGPAAPAAAAEPPS